MTQPFQLISIYHRVAQSVVRVHVCANSVLHQILSLGADLSFCF